MDFDPRSKRQIKKKVIYSPSDPLMPDHYLIYIEKFDEDFIVKKSSIKHQSNGKILISIGGTEKEGEIITSGTKSHCETQFSKRIRERTRNQMDEETDSVENDSSIHFLEPSTFRKKNQSYSDAPRRARTNIGALTTNNQNRTNEHHHEIEDIHRSRSDVQLYHKSPPCYRKNDNNKNDDDDELETDEDDVENLFVAKTNDDSNGNATNTLLKALHKKVDFVTKKIHEVCRTSNFKETQLEMYRNEKDSFAEEVLYGGENLLDISAKNPGDYGRKLLRVLYTVDELKTSMLPSTVGDRYVKPKLDGERFQVLHTAMRIKFRINKLRYEDFYTHLVRKKLSDFLLEEERREPKKAKRQLAKQPRPSIEASNSIVSCPTLIIDSSAPIAANDGQ